MAQKVKEIIKGYKITNPDGTCRGHKFEVGKEYIHKGQIKVCNSGWHFCLKASHCFNYYTFSSNNKVFEVECTQGEYETHNCDSKICCSHLKIVRELSWSEVLIIANEGIDNTGHSNSGNSNSGDRNSGYCNSGNRNSGNRNSGDCNSGNSNSGNSNSGNWNSGNWNSGYCNSGNSNSGNWNSGNSNSGDRNSGYCNSGNSNSGNWNSGNWNSGDCNSGDWTTGAFCTDTGKFRLFNKDSKWTVREFQNSTVFRLMINNLNPNIWVPMSLMTEEEKKANPKYETTEGYLKTISLKEAWKNMWGNLSDESKKEFYNLPNFNAKMFEEITGIKVSKK